jgi:malonate-semialdehyde dehydrogenase (acetylating) / methylmalonate-semialdehyde dehydrogenase
LTTEVRNCIGGNWSVPRARQFTAVTNPATGEDIARTPDTDAAGVEQAVKAAAAAFPAWRKTPAGERIQGLFRLKQLLEAQLEELARIITIENGKTLAEARGELRRGIENVEVACGTPILMQGYNLEDIAPGIDEIMVRQPLGVVAVITPFNFPAMIPLWFLPYAIACGNTVILKPSEKVPLSLQRIVELIHEAGVPPGVVNLVNGGRSTVDAILDHPAVSAVSFVGSTAVARHFYARGAAAGKRMQCQGGAKNHAVVLPDAEMESASQIIADGAFGCAGQRCLAISVVVTVAEARSLFQKTLGDLVSDWRVGSGLEPGVQMGPLITAASRERVERLIAQGVGEGAKPFLDGRGARIPSYEGGNFLRPTLLNGLPATSDLINTEIFGPVLSIVHAPNVDDAIALIANSPYGNQASIFTTSGAAARKFRSEVPAGNVGINIGVAAPVAYFPFSGWKDSFFGSLHAQGRDAIEFYTDKKVSIERWPKDWSRKF